MQTHILSQLETKKAVRIAGASHPGVVAAEGNQIDGVLMGGNRN